MSLFWLQCPKPQKCSEVKYLNLQNFSVGVKLWEWNNFFVSVFFVYFLSIAKYDRAVLLVTLKQNKKKSLTVEAIHFKHYSKQIQIHRHSMGPYDKPVAELNIKATYRMKWAILKSSVGCKHCLTQDCLGGHKESFMHSMTNLNAIIRHVHLFMKNSSIIKKKVILAIYMFGLHFLGNTSW